MHPPRALLVARNPANRRLLGELLEGEGLEVVESEAVEDAREQVEGSTGLSLGLVDIGGLTPEIWNVCEALSSDGVPVVVLAASRTDEVHEATLTAGVHSVLEKPLQKANLKAMVGSLAGGE